MFFTKCIIFMSEFLAIFINYALFISSSVDQTYYTFIIYYIYENKKNVYMIYIIFKKYNFKLDNK